MPRINRLNLTDVPQHVIQRGNNRQATFFVEEDYLFSDNHSWEGIEHEPRNRYVIQSHKTGSAVIPRGQDRESRIRVWIKEGNYPARTTIQAPLAVDGMLLEIECVAELS